MKIYIEDLVAKHSGKQEQEIPEGRGVRFEHEDLIISIKFENGKIKCYKRDSLHANPIEIECYSSNTVYLK